MCVCMCLCVCACVMFLCVFVRICVEFVYVFVFVFCFCSLQVSALCWHGDHIDDRLSITEGTYFVFVMFALVQIHDSSAEIYPKAM